MHPMIEPAVILAIFGDVDHPFGGAVKCGVKDPALGFCSSFHSDASKGAVPAGFCGFLHRLDSPGWNLPAQVFAGLFDTDEGDAVAEVQSTSALARCGHAAMIPFDLHLERNRLAELSVYVRLHPTESLFATDHGVLLR